MNVTSHDIQREIITALPEILDETTIEMEIVPQLQQLISLAPELTTVILDTLTNFKFALGSRIVSIITSLVFSPQHSPRFTLRLAFLLPLQKTSESLRSWKTLRPSISSRCLWLSSFSCKPVS